MAQASEPRQPLSPQWQAFWTAICYLVAVLIVGGGAGIWLPAFMPGKTVSVDAVTTFVMAILTPICVDLLLDFEVYGKNLSKLWRMGFAAASIIAGCLAIIGLVREAAPHGWTVSAIAVVIALVTWLVLVLKCERFMPTGMPTGSIGGGSPNAATLGGGGLPE